MAFSFDSFFFDEIDEIDELGFALAVRPLAAPFFFFLLLFLFSPFFSSFFWPPGEDATAITLTLGFFSRSCETLPNPALLAMLARMPVACSPCFFLQLLQLQIFRHLGQSHFGR